MTLLSKHEKRDSMRLPNPANLSESLILSLFLYFFTCFVTEDIPSLHVPTTQTCHTPMPLPPCIRVSSDTADLLPVSPDCRKRRLLFSERGLRQRTGRLHRCLLSVVHEDYVGFFAFFGHGDHEGAGVVLVEGDVFDSISFGVCYGIADGVRVQFDADDFSGIAGCDEADGSDSAVGVHDAFVSGETGQGDGFFVQVFRLNRVDW